MVYLSGLVGLLLVLTVDARVGNSSLCIETEQCLLFDVICKTDVFEVRHYDSVKWVSTNETSSSFDIAVNNGFSRLYDYINGTNDMGIKLEMVTPVIIKSYGEQGFFVVNFLLPAEYQLNPPNPTDHMVYIYTTAAMTVYVQSFDEELTGLSDRYAKQNMSRDLDSIHATYVKDFHLLASYVGPSSTSEAYNEVMFVAVGEPVCTSEELNQ